MTNIEEIQRLRFNYIKEYLHIKNDIFFRVVRYMRLENMKAPQIILDNEKRILKELVEKYNEIEQRLQTIEQTEAVDMGKYSCDYCLLYDEEFCKNKNPCKDFTRNRESKRWN